MATGPSSPKIDISELFVENKEEKLHVNELVDIVKQTKLHMNDNDEPNSNKVLGKKTSKKTDKSNSSKITGRSAEHVSEDGAESSDDTQLEPELTESAENSKSEGSNKNKSVEHTGSELYKLWSLKISKLNSSQPLFYQLTKLMESQQFDLYSTQTLMMLVLRKLLDLIPASEIVSDSSFVMVADYVDVIETSKVLDQLLYVLLQIVVESDLDESQFGSLILNEVMFRLRAAPVRSMLYIIQILQERQITDLRRKLYSIALDGYTTKIEQLLTPSELIEHLQMEHSNPSIHQKLEAMALKMADKMSPEELCKLLHWHTVKSHKKNSFLISKLKENLASKPFKLSLAQLKNLFYTCATLKINNKELLTKMTIAFEKQITEERTSGDMSGIILRVLKSCSFLGWRHEAFSRVVSSNIQGNLFSKELGVSDMTSLVLMLGNLNMTEFGPMAAEMLEDLGAVWEHSPSTWLELVRALAMLNQATPEMLAKVLQPVFYERLMKNLAEAPDHKKDSVRFNLLEMLGYLHLQLGETDIDGPVELMQWHAELQDRMKKAPTYGMTLAVNEVLTVLAPNDTHSNRNVVTRYGHIVDFEIFVGDDGKAKKLEEAAGATRIWIKVQDFSCFLKGGETLVPSRATEICMQHLLAKNPNTVFVPHAEWVRHIAKRIDQLMYLERKIRECAQVKEIPKMP
ncbi:hypothetical protein DPMN_128044 [Dreissena polymorpha]|uniref:RAP domain-containing protein n=2 Tax=Dreissena polymorpha TaxID=45954 RepID=A0A9D4H038_DREPO|nr:hypothetical protein DPMN_128044 [Dreissena polymorpha]